MSEMTVPLAVRRGSGDGASWLDRFDVPFTVGMSILDALIWVRANRDPSLAFRYSCINANACKECMVQIDGKTVYACTTRLGTDGATVNPLDNKAWIRDLVTDVVPPKERLENVARDET